MPAFLNSPHEATPAWVTDALSYTGALPHGHVTDLRLRANGAVHSNTAYLDLDYSNDSPPGLPRRLLLKLNARHTGENEVQFYQLAARLPEPMPMLLPCYAAAHDPASGDSYCLLQDVSATHAPPVTRGQLLALQGMPDDAQLHRMVDTLAQFHAYWWDHPLLGTVPDTTEVRWWYRDHSFHERHVRRRSTEWASFVGAVGPWFPAHLRALYERALAALPELWARHLAPRVEARRQLTLTNGNCYLSSFLCATGAAPPAYLIDFQDASVNLGAYDLVYMFATFWTREQRQEQDREIRLLRRYLANLHAHGVRHYSWDDLMTDYRLMVSYILFDPIWNQTAGTGADYWWPKLCCLADAYQDLGCADLVEVRS